MKMYWEYFKTVMKHKWHVGKACFSMGLYWQGIVHDMSKLSITEFVAYAQYFNGANKSAWEYRFNEAWMHHIAHNPHHWEYWVDFTNGKPSPVDMPEKYIKEMACDWVGAGKAYNKTWDTGEPLRFWEKNKDSIILSDKTKKTFLDILRSINTNE